jgi:hypothetical protein
MAELAAGPQIQRREVWVELPQAEYPGFQFQFWVNAPTRLWRDMVSGHEERGLAAAKTLVVGHNGWRDYDGAEYPPPAEAAFWDAIPNELLACMIMAMRLEMQRLPNSMAPLRRR